VTLVRPALVGLVGALAAWPCALAAQAQAVPVAGGAASNAPGDGSAEPSAADRRDTGRGSRANVPQRRRAQLAPYVEVGQGLVADLTRGDAVTYTTLAAGVNAEVQTARAQGQVSYRYEHRIGWGDRAAGGDIHSGLARGAYAVTPNLRLEAGALATRTRADIRGEAPGVLVGNVANVSQIYSVFAGPSLATRAGPVQIGANYRLGYTRAETPGLGGVADAT